jgi:hypothetical protein
MRRKHSRKPYKKRACKNGVKTCGLLAVPLADIIEEKVDLVTSQ